MTPAPEIPSWPQLHMRGLPYPTRMYFNGDAWRHEDITVDWNEARIPDDVASALCAMRAVEWVHEQRFNFHFQKDPQWRVWLHNWNTSTALPKPVDVQHVHDTLDSAMRAIADAVLREQGK